MLLVLLLEIISSPQFTRFTHPMCKCFRPSCYLPTRGQVPWMQPKLERKPRSTIQSLGPLSDRRTGNPARALYSFGRNIKGTSRVPFTARSSSQELNAKGGTASAGAFYRGVLELEARCFQRLDVIDDAI